MRVWIYVYMNVCVNVSMYVCMHVCMQVCLYVCMYEFPDENKQEIIELKLVDIFLLVYL